MLRFPVMRCWPCSKRAGYWIVVSLAIQPGRRKRPRQPLLRRQAFLQLLLSFAGFGWTSGLPTTALAQSAHPSPVPSLVADDPCDGLLATLDRPTVADSACSVKRGQAVVEMGFQSATIKGSDISRLSLLPQAELRYGLGDGWELKLFPPNYLTTTLRPAVAGPQLSGFGDTAFGVKKQIGTYGALVFTTDAKITLPTGNRAFSDGGLEGNVQGIVAYSITPQLGVSALLGVSTLTNRGDDGRVNRFTSFNPSVVVTYQINDRVQFYSEVFGNTVTAPHQSANYTFDGGVQFIVTKSIEIDLEVGKLLSGPAGLQSKYIGFGVGLSY
jgi:hypothetical protein